MNSTLRVSLMAFIFGISMYNFVSASTGDVAVQEPKPVHPQITIDVDAESTETDADIALQSAHPDPATHHPFSQPEQAQTGIHQKNS